MFDLRLSPDNHWSVAKLTYDYPTRRPNSFHDTFRKIVRFITINVIIVIYDT